MSFKILDVFSTLKKQETLTKQTQSDIEKVIGTIVNDQVTNPVDAYVLLDFIKKVAATSQEAIKEKVADYIDETGEANGYGATVNLQERASFDFTSDEKWKEAFDAEEIVVARRKRREMELKNAAKAAQEANQEPAIPIEKSQVLVVKYS